MKSGEGQVYGHRRTAIKDHLVFVKSKLEGKAVLGLTKVKYLHKFLLFEIIDVNSLVGNSEGESVWWFCLMMNVDSGTYTQGLGSEGVKPSSVVPKTFFLLYLLH